LREKDITAKDTTMRLRRLLVAVPTVLLALNCAAAYAGNITKEEADMVCVIDKWNESEPDKGHKLVDYAGRCVLIHDDPTAPKTTEDCVGNYEYMPDGSWKGKGTCTDTYKGGDKIYATWEEGSHLKDYVYRKTGGTGKYQGVTGGGTYMYETLTDTLIAGRVKGTLELP
jgi:hypothetical protein